MKKLLVSYSSPELFGLSEKLGEAWERVGETAAAIAVWSEARTLYERARNVSCSFVCTAAWH
jgi:hypothetical protein